MSHLLPKNPNANANKTLGRFGFTNKVVANGEECSEPVGKGSDALDSCPCLRNCKKLFKIAKERGSHYLACQFYKIKLQQQHSQIESENTKAKTLFTQALATKSEKINEHLIAHEDKNAVIDLSAEAYNEKEKDNMPNNRGSSIRKRHSSAFKA